LRIKELEALAIKHGQTQLFIEVPHRNVALLQALLTTLKTTTRLSLSSGLTLDSAQTRSAAIGQWQQQAPLQLTMPGVFSIGA
jgi:16S rRNA (cytidine1402-2'-O)-methyltransferase